MVFSKTELSQTFHNLIGDFVNIFQILSFSFTVVIGAVVITNGGISFMYFATFPEKMRNVIIEVIIEQIHSPQDVLITKIGFLIKFAKLFKASKF